MAIQYVAAGLSIAQGLSGLAGGLGASKKAKKITEANLEKHDLTTFANMKQMQKSAEQLLSENRGKIYASNILMSGSAKSHLRGLESELDKEMGWYKSQAAAERKVIKRGGQAAASAGRSAGWQALFGGLGNAATIAGQE